MRDEGKYTKGGRLIQDVIGIRVVLYFQEDIEIVKKELSKKYEYDEKSSTIDVPRTDQFSVTRYNLVYRLPDQFQENFCREILSFPIDETIEIQLRSMLSEGWHEVEHDLRYKSKSNWENQTDLSRALNGIMATLETSEWGMKKIFDDLAYRHYKNKNWAGMLQNKLRMRVDPTLSKNIIDLLNSDNNLAKELFRAEKANIIDLINKVKLKVPLNLDNLVFIWNHSNVKNKYITEITPSLMLEILDS